MRINTLHSAFTAFSFSFLSLEWTVVRQHACYCVHDPLAGVCGCLLSTNGLIMLRVTKYKLRLIILRPDRDVISHIWLRNRRNLWRTNINHVVPGTPRCCSTLERNHALFTLKLSPSVCFICFTLHNKEECTTSGCRLV